MKSDEIIETKTVASGKVEAGDMVAGACSLAPLDGVTLRSRMVMTSLNERFNGLNIPTNTQIMVFTGIKAASFNFEKTIVKTDFRLIRQNEFYLEPFAYSFDGEVVVIGHCHGRNFMMSKGLEIGTLVYL